MTNLKDAFRWIELTQKSLEDLSQKQGFVSEYSMGYNSGLRDASKLLGDEIEKFKHLLDGYMIDDLTIDECEEDEIDEYAY